MHMNTALNGLHNYMIRLTKNVKRMQCGLDMLLERDVPAEFWRNYTGSCDTALSTGDKLYLHS